MEIVELKEKDLSALAELFKQFWNESSAVKTMALIFARLSENPDYILLAMKKDDLLIGFCMGVICQTLYGDCRPFMVIEDFIVDERYRRVGAGTALMSEVEKHAVNRNCSQVILVTENNRTDAHNFYAAQGYSLGTHKGFKKQLAANNAVEWTRKTRAFS